jgi:hypothetical protein
LHYYDCISHHAGTRESFGQTSTWCDKLIISKRNVTSLGENFDFQWWIQAHKWEWKKRTSYYNHSGRQAAYRDTDFSLVWSEWIMIEWVGDIVVVEVVDAT